MIFRRIGRQFVFPLLHFAVVVPVFIAVLATTVAIEESIDVGGDFSLYGRIAESIAILVVGCPAFALSSWTLQHLQLESRLSILDHLRRCSLAYVVFAVSSFLSVANYIEALAAGYSDPRIDTLIPSVLCCAVIMDAAVLRLRRKRSYLVSDDGA
jgi:hypothetical protein